MKRIRSWGGARCQGDNDDHGEVPVTLLKSLPFSWRYPQWWWGALKRLARPAVPGFLVSALRGRRTGDGRWHVGGTMHGIIRGNAG
jgi:hypothetical protein